MISNLNVGILTVSDRSSSCERPDRGGPAVAEAVSMRGWVVTRRDVVADDARLVADRLKAWCEGEDALDLALTTGGTGLSPRDVTPEATRAVIDKEIPGLAERMRRESEKVAPMAALSRAVCGFRGRTLIVNLPGSPKGAQEALGFIAELLPHALDTLRGAGHEEKKT